MRCKTKQRTGSRSAKAPEKFGVKSSGIVASRSAQALRASATADEINDHRPGEIRGDRIRLIAIDMKGVLGNEGALPLCGGW